MKHITTILILLTLLSCSKEKEVDYESYIIGTWVLYKSDVFVPVQGESLEVPIADNPYTILQFGSNNEVNIIGYKQKKYYEETYPYSFNNDRYEAKIDFTDKIYKYVSFDLNNDELKMVYSGSELDNAPEYNFTNYYRKK